MALPKPYALYFRNPQLKYVWVHQIRNSCRYVVLKDLREFTADMKEVYTSVN